MTELQAHGMPYEVKKSPYEVDRESVPNNNPKKPRKKIKRNRGSEFIIGETKVFQNVNEAWEYWYKLLNCMNEDGFSIPSRTGISGGTVVGEVINAVSIIENPKDNIITSSARNLSIKYGIGEFLWYLSGSNRVKDIGQYSKAWYNLTDDGETVNSAYGYRIYHKFGFDQWEYVKKLLQDDPATRQAVIHIKDANNQKTKDTPCTLTLQFFIRNNELNMIVNMRSNDIWLGFPYDAFTFTCLQQLMAMEIGVSIGKYVHISGSLHLYEKDAGKEV